MVYNVILSGLMINTQPVSHYWKISSNLLRGTQNNHLCGYGKGMK
jgi:hypothetical protein